MDAALAIILIWLAILVITILFAVFSGRRVKDPYSNSTWTHLYQTGEGWKDLVRKKGEAESERLEHLRETKREAQRVRAEEDRLRREQEYNRKLEDHQRRFKCCVASCPIRSTGPGLRHRPHHHYKGEHSPIGWSLSSPDYGVTDWNIPTGLKQCDFCWGYACPEHIMEVSNRKFKCKNCALRYINS